MIKHSVLAGLMADAYTASPHWRADDRVRACLTVIDGQAIIMFPGTDPTVMADLERDASCRPIQVPGLGWCHEGFARDAMALFDLMKADLANMGEIILGGHSLGGGVAEIFAGLCMQAGIKVAAVVTCGKPRGAAQRLAWVIRDVPKFFYRYMIDPIPELVLPWVLIWPPVIFQHSGTVTQIGKQALQPVLQNHSISTYRTTLTAMGL